MALPTTPSWDLADFSGTTLGGALSLGPGDLTISPSTSPYFSYNTDFSVLNARSADGVAAQLDFVSAIPSRFTFEATLRFPELPHNFSDLSRRRAGFMIADDGGRGIAVYFSSSGLAISRVDDFGSVTALPGTAELVREINRTYKTFRIAVDSGTGRAYVLIGDGDSAGSEVRYVLPVEATPPSVVDTFRVFVRGSSTEPAGMEIRALRLASDLRFPNIPPVADAGADRVTPVGQAVRFDGRASYDVEGAALTYTWRAFDAPFGSQYAADNSSGSTVDDGDADAVTTTLSFTPASLPAWVSPGDVLRIGAERYIIASVNNPGGTLAITTDSLPDDLTGAPFRIIRQSLIVGADTETPYIVPDVQGIYRLELVVNDGESDSEPAEVLANVVAARAPLGVEPDVSPLWKALGDEWRLVENRGVFEEAWRGVAQIVSAQMLEVWQHHYNHSVRDSQRTFQKKWIAYRTLIAEPAPDDVVVDQRFGVLLSSHPFESGVPSVAGFTLSVEYATPDGALATDTRDIVFTGNSLSTIISDINTALMGTGIEAYGFGVRRDDPTYRREITGASTTDDGDGDGFTDLISFPALSLPSWAAAGDVVAINGERHVVASVNNALGELTVVGGDVPDNFAGAFYIYRTCRLGLRSSTRGFQVSSMSSAGLGFVTDVWASLRGDAGALVTDRVYYAGDGVSLPEVRRGDLLVLNNGQSFRIDRAQTGADDPMDFQRLLLSDPLPFDASETWAVPSVVRGGADYEYEGAYPGDLVKFEVFDTADSSVSDARGVVVAQRGSQLAVDMEVFSHVLDSSRFELRMLGVKRRKAVPIYPDTVGIPRLQDLIPQSQTPTIWQENVDYILEPLYRESGGEPLPFLLFRDDVFIVSDTEPPDILWAELTIFSNDQNTEDLFGRLAGLYREDVRELPDFNYNAGVAGLLYAYQGGPSVEAVRTGAQILLGQPFAEVEGTVEEIRDDYSPTTGRILLRDTTSNPDVVSEVIRTYYYKKDPLDLSPSSGLARNPQTQAPWALGDVVPQFSPIGAGVDIIDLYNDPKWYIPWVRAGLLTEIEKFHHFVVRFNLDLVTLTNLSLLFQFVTRVKPTYTYPLLVGRRSVVDNIDVIDDVGAGLTMNLVDTVCGSPRAFMYDDYRGDGTIWSLYDDGASFYDGIVDCPLDVIEFVLTIDWPGGVLTLDSAFFFDTDVVDVLGTYVAAGDSFTPTYDMTLPAGTYEITAVIKSGGVVLP
jgi:hypothetical protein